jgi:hypothetical protein
MGKPKKAQAAVTVIDKKEPAKILGNKVLYIGVAGKRQSCHSCGATYKKKIVSEYKGMYFCNEDCIKLHQDAQS